MQVSVPGMYQKPAPYAEQILTYSIGLALTGRSAACVPVIAMRPAAEPSKRLLLMVCWIMTCPGDFTTNVVCDSCCSIFHIYNGCTTSARYERCRRAKNFARVVSAQQQPI